MSEGLFRFSNATCFVSPRFLSGEISTSGESFDGDYRPDYNVAGRSFVQSGAPLLKVKCGSANATAMCCAFDYFAVSQDFRKLQTIPYLGEKSTYRRETNAILRGVRSMSRTPL